MIWVRDARILVEAIAPRLKSVIRRFREEICSEIIDSTTWRFRYAPENKVLAANLMTGRMDAMYVSGAEEASAIVQSCVDGASSLIPNFIDGVLPDGVHACTLEEVAQRFGRSQGSERRPRLTNALKRYVMEVRALGVASALVIDGSYVTIKAKPNDIDLILILLVNIDLGRELIPAEYNVRSMRMVRRKYGFDVRAVVPASPNYAKYLEFFSRVRRDDPEVSTKRTTKGLLRIEL